MKTCASCGRELSDETNFCPFCGASFKEGEQAAQQSTPYENAYNHYSTSPGTSQTVQQKGNSGMAVTGLVLGIVSIVFAFIPGVSWIAWICGVVGIIISAVAISQAKQVGQPHGMATAGLVLSIISIALGLIVFIIACGTVNLVFSSLL